jgi:hypothetical protein
VITTEPPAKPAFRRLSGVVVIVAVVVVLGAISVGSRLVGGRFEQTSTLVPQVQRLVVDNDDGDVTISPSADGNVRVTTMVRYGISRPALTETSTPEGVRLAVACAGFVNHCSADYVIQVPPAFAVNVSAGSGSVRVTSVSGDLGLDVDSGDVQLRDVSGRLQVRQGSGHVDGAAVRSQNVQVNADSGDVTLELRTPPQAVSASVGSGAVDLAVPVDGAAYRVDVDADSGQERIEVPVDPASSRSITVDTDSGDITVRPTR